MLTALSIVKGFSPEHMQQLEEIEKTASIREKEIIHIAQSINDLAQVFREMNVLVIEQVQRQLR